jgi:chemotaxis protein methyltransferase CheR
MAHHNANMGGLQDLLSLRGLLEDAPLLAEAIVDTIQEPLLLLDPSLKVIFANRSFYLSFKVEPAETLDWMVYELGNGQWDIPRLRHLLEEIIPTNNSFSDYEVTLTFPGIGRKVMRLNGKRLRRREGQDALILLAIHDITALYEREERLKELLREREALVQEIHHRVKNNLQTIVSLLNMHVGHTDNPVVTTALNDAGERVHAIARLHERLYTSPNLDEVNAGDYLRTLAGDLQELHRRPEITFGIVVDDMVIDMDRATPLALIANELIQNCLKHAFPAGHTGHVEISLQYVPHSVPEGEPLDNGLAMLQIQDNGISIPSGVNIEESNSMGLTLVRLLLRQLHANFECIVADGVKWTIVFPLASETQGKA